MTQPSGLSLNIMHPCSRLPTLQVLQCLTYAAVGCVHFLFCLVTLANLFSDFQTLANFQVKMLMYCYSAFGFVIKLGLSFISLPGCGMQISHYPKNYKQERIAGLGLNNEELRRNGVLYCIWSFESNCPVFSSDFGLRMPKQSFE